MRVVALNRTHLQELVDADIQHAGPACNLNHIDVSQVTDFSYLFSGSQFVGDISEWDVSNATSMAFMFLHSPFNGDISKWNVGKVINMSEMFKDSDFSGDLSLWDTSEARVMDRMFYASKGHPTGLEHWNVSNVETFFRMFKKSTFAPDLSRWTFGGDAYVEALLDRSALEKTPASMYHWYTFASDARPALSQDTLNEAGIVPLRQLLSRSMVEHFDTYFPMTLGLGLDKLDAAKCIQTQWLNKEHGHPMDALPLPSMEAP